MHAQNKTHYDTNQIFAHTMKHISVRANANQFDDLPALVREHHSELRCFTVFSAGDVKLVL